MHLDTPCIEWSGALDGGGYGQSWRGDKPEKAHRLAYIDAKGPIPPGKLVCHHCDNRACINPDHLFLGTHADNTADMMSKGRWRGGRKKGEATGAANGRAVLTESDVITIRALAAEKSQREIARQFGVSRTTIYSIIHRINWTHV